MASALTLSRFYGYILINTLTMLRRILLAPKLHVLGLLGLCSLLICQPLSAAIYKWVDSNGVTQFSSTPPPKGDYNKVKEPPPPAKGTEDAAQRLQEKNKAFAKRREAAGKTASKEQEKARKAAEQARKCDKARANLNYFQTKARIRYTDKKGNTVIMPEDERQKRIKDMQTNIKKLCK
jgi:hypothetical protein